MLKAFAAALLTLVSSAALASDKDTTALRKMIEARLPDLNAFVRVATGYKAMHLPKLVIKDRVSLYRIVYGEHYTDQDKACDIPDAPCVKAAAMQGVIFIGDDFVKDRDDYILVHELTHFQQYESGREFECLYAREPEAYETADKFIQLTGRGRKSDAFTVALLSSCHGGQ